MLDEMVAIESLEPFNIATKKEVIDKLSNTELRYIDKSQSSYSITHFTLASMMLLDYHQKPSSPQYSKNSSYFPDMMYSMQNKIPLISSLKKASSSFIWVAGKDYDCKPSISWTCVISSNIRSNRGGDIFGFFGIYFTDKLINIATQILCWHIKNIKFLAEQLKQINIFIDF